MGAENKPTTMLVMFPAYVLYETITNQRHPEHSRDKEEKRNTIFADFEILVYSIENKHLHLSQNDFYP